jgi:hypothetical protein
MLSGSSSELRSMFFRFCRLYELGIRPVFVFDGPNRPEYKRNKHINTQPLETEFRRQLICMIHHFKFSMWIAYGEAEAECAMLQRLGFVDVVLTGDSDVFLFGARRVIRQWPAKRLDTVPCYDLSWIYDSTGHDRSDLILMALLRGSDYDTKGTKGIGIRVAAQLSKCHFHRELMDDIQLAGREVPLDDARVQHLFDDLTYELNHNSTKNLSRKYTGVVLDPKFPDFSIVTDFIHPLTNIADSDMIPQAARMRHNLNYYCEPNWLVLAPFTQIAFKWPAEYVLKRFSSLLFPAYMANGLRRMVQPQRRVINNDTSSQQTTLLSYYQSTPRFHLPKRDTINDIVTISGSKVVYNTIPLYRVEWNKSCWEEFLNLVKTKLNTELYLDEVTNEDEETELTSSQKKYYDEEDIWNLVKRQWVDATHIHNVYPSLALEYQSKKRKAPHNSGNTSGSNQAKIDSFLIIPPKRRNRIK